MNGETRTTSATGGQKGVKPIVFSQIPYEALRQKGLVYSYGAAKYDAHNFRKGYEWSKSFDALCRHLFAFWSGEDLDPESGLPHMAHVGWHADVLVTFMVEHPQFDDRYKPYPTLAEVQEWAHEKHRQILDERRSESEEWEPHDSHPSMPPIAAHDPMPPMPEESA